MSLSFDVFVRSWPAAPWLTATLSVMALVYTRGWRRLHDRDPGRWPAFRLASYLGGLVVLLLALASPIETFTSMSFPIHMLQHLLLMVAAPPLLWLGWPLFPLLRGLPDAIRRYWVVPLMRWSPLRRLTSFLTEPLVAWALYVATTWLWHTPQGYEMALADDRWHLVEHACFLGTAMLFWYPVIQPYPTRRRSRWFVFPYLLLAGVQSTLLAAWLTFAPHVLYPHYERVPRIGGLSPLEDQRLGGVLMWVPGSIAYLLPLFAFGVAYLFGTQRKVSRRRVTRQEFRPIRRRVVRTLQRSKFLTSSATCERTGAVDLLQTPGIGRFLSWRHGRRCLQVILAALAACVIVDGLAGPQLAPLNLAGVLPWIPWRGLLILSLLVAGNVFCMACPFTLPRSIARRWLPGGRPWPHWLRSKWLAAGLVAAFLWSYEAFALWDSPWVTAWIAVGYFTASFVVDSLFKDAAFCKYVCPIGQFNFVQSLMSPTEVTVRQPGVCASCTTHECLRGSETVPGCGMQLFQPTKVGNLDCTFCLDCVRSCPHDNVGVIAVVPGRSLWADPLGTGRGKLRHRPDVAALMLILTFGAFANAAGMVAPVLAMQDRWRDRLGGLSPLAASGGFFLLAIIVGPLTITYLASALSCRWSGEREPVTTVAMRYIPALVPIGFGMWLAHYSYHFFTSWDTIIPSVQRFAADHGVGGLGPPRWQSACCRPAADWVTQLQIVMLDFGLLAALYVGWRIAEQSASSLRQAGKAFAPWGALIVVLFVLGIWIILQPMEMRGTLPALSGELNHRA